MKVSRNTGFTLVELLSIILILGIVSVVATSRLDINPFRTATFEQELRSAIRFAQKFAIVSGCEVQVTVNPVGYQLRVQVPAGSAANACPGSGPFDEFLNNPNGGVFDITAPFGVTIAGGATFVYDARGGTPVAQSFTVGTQTITVEPVTGYVY